MKKQIKTETEKDPKKPERKHGNASQGDSSRTRKGDPSRKAKGKAEGRK